MNNNLNGNTNGTNNPNISFDPMALQSTLLSAHFLSGYHPLVSATSLSSLNEQQKSQLLPSMIFANNLAKANKPTPWYPWSLTISQGMLAASNPNLFSPKDSKEGK